MRALTTIIGLCPWTCSSNHRFNLSANVWGVCCVRPEQLDEHLLPPYPGMCFLPPQKVLTMFPLKPLLILFSTLPLTPVAADFTQVDGFWSDLFFSNNPLNPLTDNNGTPLANAVLQMGYFQGVDPAKDPATYSAQDWASFTALSGDGSTNAAADPANYSTVVGSVVAGYFEAIVPLDTNLQPEVPASDVRVGVRFFNGTTRAGSTLMNTVSSGDAGWIMPAPIDPDPVPPFPARADLDTSYTAGTLIWQGTPFQTDVNPSPAPPELSLTTVNQTGPTSLEISWTGGDGSNDIQTSIDGVTFTTVLTGQASPAAITINLETTRKLLVRVIEP